jgi:hypothetical protein
MSKRSLQKELYELAKQKGLDVHHFAGADTLRQALQEAGFGPEANDLEMDHDAREVESPISVDPMLTEQKISPEDVLHNKLTAYGVPYDQHKKTLPDLEAQLKRVLAARAKAAEKRKMADEGDYYGKTAKVRITRMGDDLVGTGEYIAGIGNLCYAAGEEPELPLKTAEELQDRGLVEIMG